MRTSMLLSAVFTFVITFALGNAQAAPDAEGAKLLAEVTAARKAASAPAVVAPQPAAVAAPAPATPTAPVTVAGTPAKAGTPVAAPIVAPKKAKGGGSRRITVMQCEGQTAKKPGIAMVHGDPRWRSNNDSEVPKTPVCGPDEAAVVVGNTQYKYDQQCLDWKRGQAATDPNTWLKTGQLFAHAANVTPVNKEIRIWCVPANEVVTQENFGNLAKLLKELSKIDGINWDAIRELLKQAPNFATKEMVVKLIQDVMGDTKRLLKATMDKVAQLEERIDNLEAQSISFDVGAAGGFVYPTAFSGVLKIALNVPFAQSKWFWQTAVGVGVGYKGGQMSPAFKFSTSWNKQIGRFAVGPNLSFDLLQWEHTRLAALTVGPRIEVRLTGPDYRQLSPSEVRERNGKVQVELVWYLNGGVGGAVTPVSRGYNVGFSGGAETGLLFRIGRRHPINYNPDGTRVASIEDAPIEADGPSEG